MTLFNTNNTNVVASVVRNTPVVRPSFSLSRVRWSNVVLVVAVPVVLACMAYAYVSKPVLEDTVQWVEVVVPAGGGYDLAIKQAYAQVSEYDIKHVDVRDLRYMAIKRNNDKQLVEGTTIEVPVYTSTSKYRR